VQHIVIHSNGKYKERNSTEEDDPIYLGKLPQDLIGENTS
jgi:hypothetical protein